MKRYFTIILILILANSLNAQNMITRNILQDVFHIKFKGKTGTSFLVSIENKGYLVTAKHLFHDTLKSNSPVVIEISQNNNWIKINSNLLIHENKSIDIAVLDIHSNNIKELNFDIGNKNYFLSQECFFLGYPFGLRMEDTNRNNRGFPVPFVKKGIISSFITDTLGTTRIFLDGHNNSGFSGGPVVIINNDNKQKMRIIGVVSAYLNEKKTIKTPIGDFVNNENSGIVLAYSFDHVFEIIEKQKN